MNEFPQQYLLTQANKWIDLYGYIDDPGSSTRAIAHKITRLKKDPTNLSDCLDLVKHLALYTGGLWRHIPEIFDDVTDDLTALPEGVTGLKDTQHSKHDLKVLVNRCARLPRQERSHGCIPYSGEYEMEIDFLYTPVISDDMLIEAIIVYFETLWYEAYPEDIPQLLNILLSDAWELYLRAWERTASAKDKHRH